MRTSEERAEDWYHGHVNRLLRQAIEAMNATKDPEAPIHYMPHLCAWPER